MDDGARDAVLLPAAALLRDLPALRLDAAMPPGFRQGAAVAAPGRGDGACAVFGGGDLLGVADVGAGARAARAGWSPAPLRQAGGHALKSKRFSGYNFAFAKPSKPHW